MFQAACCCNMHRFECSQLETDVENRLFGKLYDEKSSIIYTGEFILYTV